MKKFKIIVILIIIIGIIYYQLDQQLFYYGRNNLHFYHLLPLKIEPDYSPPFEGGFALRDEYGFSIAGKGVAYPVYNRTIGISDVLKYGFNANNLVAIVIDSSKNKYYVKFNRGQKDSTVINATMDVDNNLSNLNMYKWIKIYGNDDLIWNLVLWRNFLTLIIIVLFSTLIYTSIRYRKYRIKRSSKVE
jgi:hypothetical protein